MRNLKKVLSLTLALVMLLGMMVVGAGAVETNFPDNDKIGDVYKEAVLVMNALNIFQGDNQGKINPKNTLTRAEAAKIMTIVMLGEGGAKGFANVTESTYFTDMKDSSVSWACGYVDYCASVGIIKGNTATTVNPKGTLRAVDFATMLLRAAGVDEADTLEGPNYEVRTIAAAGKYNISDVTRADITREAAAKMALEAIQVSPSGENTFIVTTADGVEHTFTSASEAYFFSKANSDAPVTMTTAKDSLAAKLKLDSHAGTDAFGRTTKVWTVDGKDKVTIESGSAVLTFTTKKDDLSKELKGYKFDSLKKVNVLTNGAAEDGETDKTVASTDFTSAANVATETGNGKLVEIYADSSKNVTKIVIVEYKVGALDVATSKTRTTYTVAGQSGIDYVDEDTTDTVVFHGAAEKDDIVTAAKVGTTLHIYPTTVVTGTLSSINTNGKTVTVAGDKYTVGTAVHDGTDDVAMADFDDYLGKDDVNVYIDVNGVAVFAKTETAAPTDYCYVVSAAGTVETTVDGTTPKIEARVVLADGTVGVYKLAVKNDNNSTPSDTDDDTKKVANVSVLIKNSSAGSAGSRPWKTDLETGWEDALSEEAYLYSLDDKNVMTLTAIPDDSNIATEQTVVGTLDGYDGVTSKNTETNGKTALFDDNTIFVVYNAATKSASVITGRSNLGASTDLDGKAIMKKSNSTTGMTKIFFATGTVGSADTGDYVYVDNTSFERISKGDGKVRVYMGVAPDGSEVEVTGPDDTSIVNGEDLYYYNADREITAKFADGATTKHTGTASVEGKLIKIESSSYFTVPEDLKPVYIDEEGTKIDGNEVIVVLKDGVVTAIYVTDASVENTEPPTEITGTIPVTVAVTNVPTTGSMPTASSTNANVNVSISWSGTPGTSGSLTKGTYTGTITVTAKPGYTLGAGVQYNVNNGGAKNTIDTVSVTVKEEITGTIAITVSTSNPSTTGNMPTASSTNANVDVSISWSGTPGTNGSLNAGTYTGTITVTPKAGYMLASGVKYDVNNGGAKTTIDTVSVTVS